MSFSLFEQLKGYNSHSFKADFFAALTVSVIVIPQGMAYAMLAGLPPIYGLYAAFIPLLIYPLFGSSKQLSVGPVALVSIIVLAGISKLADPGTSEFIQLSLLTSLIAGLIQIILSWLKLGFLVNFLSEPVIAGFTFAAAFIIAFSQVKHLLGIDLPTGFTIVDMIRDISSNISGTNVLSMLVGIFGLILILVLKKIKRNIPGALIAVIIGTLLVYFLSWSDRGVAIIGAVPKGLPSITFEFVQFSKVMAVLPIALVICLISFIESLAIAKTISSRNNNYPISANRELFGLGIAKVIGSFFQAFPNTGSFSRSAINNDAGARTGLSSIYTGLLIGLTLLFFTPLFYYLPKPILAAIVIAAVVGLIDITYVKKLLKIDRKDFYVLLTTFVLTLLLGIQQGVLVGIILSMILILYKHSKPHYAVLEKLEGTTTYRSKDRFRHLTEKQDELFIFRYDQDIFFANAEHFYDAVLNELEKHPRARAVIFDFKSINSIDTTGMHKFELLYDAIEGKGLKIILAGLTGPVRDFMHKSHLVEKLDQVMYLTVQDAVTAYTSKGERAKLSKKYAAQTNIPT